MLRAVGVEKGARGERHRMNASERKERLKFIENDPERLFLEEHMNEILHLFGLQEWYVLWEPDIKTEFKGECFPDDMSILISGRPEDAVETLIHEILEIKLRPLLGAYMSAINQLMTLVDKLLYSKKERFLQDITPLMVQAIQDKLQKEMETGEEKAISG